MPHRIKTVATSAWPTSAAPVEASGMDRRVASLGTRSPVTVTPETPLRSALQKMEDARIGSIIVVAPDTGHPVGIFTLQDVLRRVALQGAALFEPIAQHMTGGNLVTLRENGSARQAATLMARHHLRHVLIVNADGKLTGVVSKNDLYDLLCTSCVHMRNAKQKALQSSNSDQAKPAA